jgi:hypothetical protein
VQVHNLVSYLIGSTELVVTIKYCLLGKRYFSNIALFFGSAKRTCLERDNATGQVGGL